VVPLWRFLQGVRQTDRAQNELVSAVHIPTPPVNSYSSFVKLGARKYLVISICMVAVLAVVEGDRLIDIRIAIGAASPVAQRLTTLEDHLRDCALGDVQNRMTADLIQSLTPITDVRASADYRLAASATLIRRAVTLAFKGVI
jgi:CO/xanthine dehydrogenase FAD-binding subunit